ncbi:uncharacterized protein LOC126803920 isoform X2 [Argentina anserina]|uniref:uncharacterized protein LOC126803920 isoform X2 n=1 Tax=Argentina anserina TaxID=57926 RepID=UPI00217663A8|nr:uncharacterized protein LOC126803920 isoform X2 [Potentilla anserina]
MASAIRVLGKGRSILEKISRLYVTKFLRQYVSTGCLILSEDGGTVEETFEGTKNGCSVKCVLIVHDPAQFYWKVMTRADLGLADAYIDGDFSLADKEKGLENLFTILNANRDSNSSLTKLDKIRRLLDACLSPARYLFHYGSGQNTLTQARRNVSRHYDLSNELFSIFLDETMSYSTAVFKKDDEDLKTGQLRKINTLIQKARITKDHEVLEIGCGWGGFAIEVVKQIGCRYTGITLSKEQLEFAEQKVKDAGLEESIKFLLCDYRTLPQKNKYDRIVSCEMVEHVGHEYMVEFFATCDSALAENGLLVLQFTSLPDELYNEYRQCPSFIREYIFPGGCLPSLSRLTSAMAASSRLSVEHLENIGSHYYRTLKYWRKNFLDNQSEIRALGFDDKFIRTWEYYFDYCAAGFNACTMGNYQIVFSRPGNVAVLNDPYKGFPSAYY